METEPQVNARRKNRPNRVPLHEQGNRLTVEGRDPNFVYRWVNDVDNGIRVNRFKTAGYEVVQDDVTIGDPAVDNKINATGTVKEQTVSRSGTRAILMRIPKEWYEADQRAKHARVDEKEKAMYEDAVRNYGEIKGSGINTKVTK